LEYAKPKDIEILLFGDSVVYTCNDYLKTSSGSKTFTVRCGKNGMLTEPDPCS
jgi:hypothetical protein